MNTSEVYDNTSKDRGYVNTYGCAIASCVVALFSVSAIVGNSFTIIVLSTGKFLTKPYVYFLISLAVADLLTGVINSFSIHPSIAHVWSYGEPFCFFTNYGRECILEISLLMILCLNLERFLAISYPFRSKIWVTRKRGKVIIFLCWFLTFSLKTYLLSDAVFVVEYNEYTYTCTSVYNKHRGIAITSSTMVEVPGLLILTVTSVKLTRTLRWIHSNRRKKMLGIQTPYRRRNLTDSRQLRKKLHGYKVLVVIATVAYITLLPSLTLHLMNIFREDEDAPIEWTIQFSFFWLASCGSFANVFVYFFMDRKFSKCLREILKKSKDILQRTPAVLSREGSSEEHEIQSRLHAMNSHNVITEENKDTRGTHSKDFVTKV